MSGARRKRDQFPPAIPGYADERVGSARVIARRDVLDFVSDAVRAAGTLYDFALAQPDAETIAGRATIYVIPGPGDSRWLVRRLTHGGFLAPLTGDRFLRLGTPRPFRELLLSQVLRDMGVPTPAVLAAAVYRSGPIYRGEVAREEIFGAEDLGATLFARPQRTPSQRLAALAAAGRLVGSLHQAGVVHPDLNLRNVLLEWCDGAPRAYILDLEKCRRLPQTSARQRRLMLSRFRRSARRFQERTGLRISADEWEAFGSGYTEQSRIPPANIV